jgi:glycosyltransferase involved in cell wall biosynthesis
MAQSKLKVGIIGPCPPPHGGVTRVIENHLKYWDSDEYEAVLMSPHVALNSEPYPQIRLAKASDSIKFSEFLSGILRVGWRFGLSSWSAFKSNIYFDIHVKKIIKNESFDVVYVHHAALTGLIGVTEAHAAGIPVILASYGETWLAEKSALRWKRAISYTIKNADWLVTTSEHCCNGVAHSGGNKSKATIIYAGVDLERYRPGLDGFIFRSKIGIPKSAIVVSILGLVLKRKLDTFLNALELLLKENSNLYVLIGGSGQDEAYLSSRLLSLGNERIRALGFIPEQELPFFYAATDILVVAPKTIVECMGQSMKEAMSCGVPIVGARLGGVPEALEVGNCGVMFEPDNPQDLNRALNALIDDEVYRKQLGRNGRMEAEKRFDAKISAKKMFDVLIAIANKK